MVYLRDSISSASQECVSEHVIGLGYQGVIQ